VLRTPAPGLDHQLLERRVETRWQRLRSSIRTACGRLSIAVMWWNSTVARPSRPPLDELDLSRTLELAATAFGESDERVSWSARGSRVIPNRQRLAAMAVLGEWETHLSAVAASCPGRCGRVVALGTQRR
jgi:hypothetical protein